MRPYVAPVLAVVGLSLLSAPFLRTSKAARPRQTPVVKKLDHLRTPAVPQGAEGGLWRTDGNFQCSLTLKNGLETTPITVTPVLYMADGTEYDLSPVELDSSGTAVVNINNALQSAPANVASHMSAYGSAAIRFQWSWAAAVLASVQNIDESRSLVYSMPLQADTAQTQAPTTTKSQEMLESMWWKADDQMGGFIALSNTSLNAVTATVQVLGSNGTESTSNTVTLSPHNSSMLDLGSMWKQLTPNSSEGGIRISYTGSRDALVANGGLEEGAKGYSLRLGFFPKEIPTGGIATSSPQVISVASPGIMVGTQEADMQFPKDTSFTPYMTLRNTTTQPIQVQLATNYMSGGSPLDVPLGTVTLAAEAVQQVNLTAMLNAAGLGGFNGYLNLRASFEGFAGDLLIATGSVDQTLNYVFEVPPSKTTRSNARSFCYWNAGGDTDTMLTFWNQSTTDQDFILTIFHSQGQYLLPVHLAANASTTMNISSIIKQGSPDSAGNTVPSNITEGSMKLSGAKGDQEVIDVATSVAVFNVRTATCSAPCSHCIGIAGSPYTGPTSVAVSVGQASSAVYAYIMYDNTLQVDESTALTWNTDSTSIATTTGYGSQTVTGVAVGTAYLEAYPTDEEGIVDGGGVENCHNYGDGWGCNMTSPGWNCPVTVGPTIAFTSGGLNFIFVGTDPNVTGYNLQQVVGSPSGGTYSWSGPSGVSFSPNNSTSADVTTVTSSTASSSVGDKTLSVTYTVSGVASPNPATKAITVRVFKYVTNSVTPNTIPSGEYGYSYTVTYTCYTNPAGQVLASGFSDIPVPESVNTVSSNYSTTLDTADGTTNANSQFTDTLAILSNTQLPSDLSNILSQTFTIQGVQVRNNTLTYSSTTVTITNNGPTS